MSGFTVLDSVKGLGGNVKGDRIAAPLSQIVNEVALKPSFGISPLRLVTAVL
jgi:hypothetical protein